MEHLILLIMKGISAMNKPNDSIKRHTAYDVYLLDKLIDTVYYGANIKVDEDEVKQSLINHDGYNPNIEVKRRKK